MANPYIRTLGTLSIVMITVGSVDSIRNLPAAALFGSSLIFFYLFGFLLFLLPCALVSAELAAALPDKGGVYGWVREAFGKRAGFFAIWFQWIENVIWYPTILSFVAGTFGYLIAPLILTYYDHQLSPLAISDNQYFLIFVILIAFWAMTFLNLRGIKTSAGFATFCAFCGLIIPMTLIISLGTLWYFSGKPLQISLSPVAWLPDWHNHDVWIALTGIMLSFGGIEIAAVHGKDVKNPQSTYPKAMLISILIIMTTLVFGSLAIAIILPQSTISLVSGIMEAMDAFLQAYHLHAFLPLIAIMLILGGLGGVNNWIIAPARGLLYAAEDGAMPTHFAKQNKFGAPKHVLLYQAFIVSILCVVFLLLPNVNASYWLLNALASLLYMFMYIMMFMAVIKLRYTAPEMKRPFTIPGKNWGVWIIGLTGIIGCTITLLVGLIPPDNMQIGSNVRYESLLLIGLIVMSLPPFFAYCGHKNKSIT